MEIQDYFAHILSQDVRGRDFRVSMKENGLGDVILLIVRLENSACLER
jgi:hypothetical protein